MADTWVNCKECGIEFAPRVPSKVYCSKRCRMARYRNTKTYNKICPLCGIAFTTTSMIRKYCSTPCYTKHRSALYISSTIRPIIMEAIMERDNFQCQDCGKELPRIRDKNNHGHIHHKVPLLKGGKDEATNIVLLCSSCHGVRHKLIRERTERSNRASVRE